MLTCPLCGKTNLKNILAHYKIHVKNITREKFLELYPEWDQPFQYDNRKRDEYKCPYCDKIFMLNNALQSHIRTIHKEEWEHIKEDHIHKEEEKKQLKGQQCKICNEIKIDLKQHVEIKHNIKWSSYCEQYDHDITLTKIVDEEYRKLLSKNKKKFYNETENGKLLRKIQSEKWKGENNIVYKDGVMEKSMYSRSQHGLIPNTSVRGIHCWYKNIDRTTRSYEELKFIILLEMNNINYEYEPGFVLKYWNSEKNFITSYLPDFRIDGKYYELKVLMEQKKILKNIESTKYYEIVKAFNKINVGFEIISIESFSAENNIFIDSIDIDNVIRSKYNNEEIRFTCKENSAIVRRITGISNLKEAKGVTLYD